MNVTLIGMAGVGKSTIGGELARALGYRLVDVDKLIEKETGQRLQRIIDERGDAEFIRIEEKSVLAMGDFTDCVIAPGGSVVYSERAMRYLKERSFVVFLNAPFETISARVRNYPTRGIVGLKTRGIRAVFDERLPLYKKYADAVVDLPQRFDEKKIVKEITNRIGRG